MSSLLGIYSVAPAQLVFVELGHGDSRIGSVYTVTPPAFNTLSKQYVNSGAVANGYTTLTTPGITDVTVPYQNPVNNQGSGNVIPMHYGNHRFVTETGMALVQVGGGYNGAKVAGSGHTLGPLPDAVTTYNVANMNAALAQAASDYPAASIVPLCTIVATTNDVISGVVDPVDIQTAYYGLFSNFSSAWPGIRILVVSVCPELLDADSGGAFCDTAQRVAALTTPGVCFCQLPVGVGLVHEGEVTGQGNLPGIQTAGNDYYGYSLLAMAGYITPPTTVFQFSANFTVEQNTNADITLNSDYRTHWTIASGGSNVALSGDLVFDVQTLGPVGGTWTTQGVFAYSLNWYDQFGRSGTLSGSVTVTAPTTPPVWLLYDDVSRADVAQGTDVVGNSSGQGGHGGGIPGLGVGGIRGGKLFLSGPTNNPLVSWDTGVLYKEFEVTVTLGALGRRPAIVAVALDPTVGDRIWWQSDNGTNSALYVYIVSAGLALVATGPRLAAGTYDVKVGCYSNGHVKAFVDGVQVMDGTSPFGTPPSSGATCVAVSIDGANPSVLFANPRCAVTIP